jgi:Resolvase, N terminal domain
MVHIDVPAGMSRECPAWMCESSVCQAMLICEIKEINPRSTLAMNPKITAEHLKRGAAVYVRQSTPGQVVEHTESKRRQYALADTARSLGFASVAIIDEDLGRSGSGLVERPGFQRLVATVCGASTLMRIDINFPVTVRSRAWRGALVSAACGSIEPSRRQSSKRYLRMRSKRRSMRPNASHCAMRTLSSPRLASSRRRVTTSPLLRADPAKRPVARELEARWNSALERVAEIEGRIRVLDEASAERPSIDRAALLALAHDLPTVWNSTETPP